MYKSIKLRIYPNKKQERLIIKTFGCSRFVYNHYLEKKIKLYEENKETFSHKQCSKDLTDLKKELPWLKEPDKFSLQCSLENLDLAYDRFFDGLASFPKFKAKKHSKESYTTKFTNNNIQMFEKHIKLPKLGLVKYNDKSFIEGKIVSVTVSRTRTGKYFASVTY